MTSPFDIPPGWKLVPVEPDESMWRAGWEADVYPGDSYTAVYCAMVSAAPEPPALQPAPVADVSVVDLIVNAISDTADRLATVKHEFSNYDHADGRVEGLREAISIALRYAREEAHG